MASDQQQRGYRRPPFFHPTYSSPPIDRSTIPSPFRIDEGFSEEAQLDSDIVAFQADQSIHEPESSPHAPNIDSLRTWLLAQPAHERAAVARDLLASVPTSLLSSLVTEANARLHFDPIRCLPKEIISYVFEFLDPPALLNASLVSQLWTSHVTEPRLWKRLFALEGWSHHPQKIRQFEDTCISQIRSFNSLPALRQQIFTNSSSQSLPSLRPFRQGISNEGSEQGQISRLWVKEGVIDIPPTWPLPHSSSLAHSTHRPYQSSTDPDEEMQDAPSTVDPNFDLSDKPSMLSGTPVCPLLLSPYLIDAVETKPKTNWKYIYKQRRKLEQNWIDARFTPFRLPHPDYPDDAHRQCVYTLQFSPRYLVSGSRDKSVRVWDLSTQRLKMLPLLGHDGSVLCVQFDERPEQDVIVSGSSDADVIIWRFSTGGMIKRLRKAHAESVLNLRFDDRYLVTCSKDKTIKLWNRRELLPTDPEYPQTNQSPNATYPHYILDIKELYSKPRPPVTTPLMPYTLLMTFNEHNAAVNAIQIHGNEIVSASGDRKIMLWDIPSGKLVRIFTGHSKGIACVQYDGRRIISGSSDNSVRIFDTATAAEVAVLEGHRDLVRTIQADFGDVPGDEDILEAQARENDQRILQSKRMELAGEEPLPSNPDTPWVFGAKLPPNGGGSKWSKIISGSYDETVIIWRKDKAGEWVAAKELRQDDAIRATAPGIQGADSSTTNFIIHNAGRRINGICNSLPFSLTLSPDQIFQKAIEVGMPPNLAGRDRLLWIRRNLLIGRPARPGFVQFYRILSTSNVNANTPTNMPQGTLFASLPGPLPAHLHPNHPHFQYHISSPQSANRGGLLDRPEIFHHVARQLMDPQIQAYFHQQLTQAQFSATSVAQPTSTTPQQGQDPAASVAGQPAPPEPVDTPMTQSSHSPDHLQADLFDPTVAAVNPPMQRETSNPHQQPTSASSPANSQQAPAPHRSPTHDPAHTEPGFSRVFKLQFDSRRIICCSQQPVMVGWDFANGDRDIEEASQFFD